MEFTGLIKKYPSNVPLSDWAESHRLKQQERLLAEPHYQLSVIKMNSSYLESVDKWFAWKGTISTIMVAVFCILVGGGGSMIVLLFMQAAGFVPSRVEPRVCAWYGLLMTVLVSAIGWTIVWIFRKESFAYTHYPIRFNRQTRMVHVFRTNGTILSVPWDEVFFSLGRLAGECEVRGYVLDKSRATILETFVLSYMGVLSDRDLHDSNTSTQNDYVRGHWEFIRRYMEDGPESIAGQVQFCMPIDRCKERAINGFHRIMANFSGGSFVLIAIMFPFCALIALVRALAMKTGKIPQWPEEIEAVNVIDPDDPYAIRGDDNGNRIAVFPRAAYEAGVAFSETAAR